MGIRKVMIVVMFLSGIIFGPGIDSLQCQEKTLAGSKETVSENLEYPAISADIPEEVYKVAEEIYKNNKNKWLNMLKDSTVDFGSIHLSRKPVKQSYISSSKMLKCSSGADILSKIKFWHYLFNVLNEEKIIGVLGVAKHDVWKFGLLFRTDDDHYGIFSKLRKDYPESEGYQVDLISIVKTGWFIMISNPTIGEYWITSNDKTFIREYDFKEVTNGKRNIVSLETMLPKFVEKAEKMVEQMEKDKRRGHPVYR